MDSLYRAKNLLGTSFNVHVVCIVFWQKQLDQSSVVLKLSDHCKCCYCQKYNFSPYPNFHCTFGIYWIYKAKAISRVQSLLCLNVLRISYTGHYNPIISRGGGPPFHGLTWWFSEVGTYNLMIFRGGPSYLCTMRWWFPEVPPHPHPHSPFYSRTWWFSELGTAVYLL